MQPTDDDIFTAIAQILGAVPGSVWKVAAAFITVWLVVRLMMAVLAWGDRRRDAYFRLDAPAHTKTRAWRAFTRLRLGRLLPAAIRVDEQEAWDLPFKTLSRYGDVLIAFRGRHASAADAGAAARAFRVIQAEVIARRVEWAKTHDSIKDIADGIRDATLTRRLNQPPRR